MARKRDRSEAKPRRAEAPAGTLERVERELERIGLLLEHDAVLPSVTRLVAGEPIRGSWWGHAFGHAIYELLQVLAERSGRLDAKLVNGKVTYVHARLWPAFFGAVEAIEAPSTELSPLALRLLSRVRDGTSQRIDELARAGVASSKELTAASRELEARLLVHSSSMHTASGAHTRVLRGWASWRGEHASDLTPLAPEAGRGELEAACARLAHASSAKVQLAL